MQLTQEIADRYVGGQLEAQNYSEGYLYRGEIAAITVDGEGDSATLNVKLNWMAQGEGYPPYPRRWVTNDRLEFSASLFLYVVADIGDGRVCVDSPFTGEAIVFFPPGGSRLDPAKVEGLIPKATPS